MTSLSLVGDPGLTRVTADLDAHATVTARSLSNPSRVIVDLPETSFHLPPGTGATGHGLISRFRYGLIEAGKSRIVLDTTDPVRVDRVEVIGPAADGRWQLEIDLAPVSQAEQAARELANAVLDLKPTIPDTPSAPRSVRGRHPVIVVDAGHGGIDSGAEGTVRLEKHVVLDVARELERNLLATGRYDVIMTRQRDVFVSLDQRVQMSSRSKADLFISIHADSLSDRDLARAVRGATVYTLAERASDEFARRMAEKENAVDLLAGLPYSQDSDGQVRAILIDLMRREFAHVCARLPGRRDLEIALSHSPGSRACPLCAV